MRVQVGENSVKLIPESKFEKEALERLKRRGINKMEFQDPWNYDGFLRLEHKLP